MATEPDRWSRWLAGGRDAGDDRQREVTLERLAPIRDRVLDGAEPLEGATLLDGSPNPLAPTVRQTIEHALGEDEQRRFLAHLAKAFEAGATSRWAGAYLTARKAM